MRFTTRETAELLGAGHHGPSRDATRVVIDPGDLNDGCGQLFVASAHPPPLGDTSLKLLDDIAQRVPYLTERSWMGGTAVNGPSTEAMLRTMALDRRGRPAAGDRIGVLGATAPWITAALARAALGPDSNDKGLPQSGPLERREPPGTERFRMPVALLNHAGDRPLAVVLNRKLRGCSGADAALFDPTAVVITDLKERDLATLGRSGSIDGSIEVVQQLSPGALLAMPDEVAAALRDADVANEPRWPTVTTYRASSHHSVDEPDRCSIRVSGSWGETEVTVEVGADGGSLALPVGGAVAIALAAGRNPEEVVSRVGTATRDLAHSMVMNLAEGAVVWDRSDATSFGDVTVAVDALAMRPASSRFLVLGPLDDGPTVVDGLHARLGRQATAAGIVVRSANAWGTGFSFLEHPQIEVDDLAAAGPGAVILLAGAGAELLSVRDCFRSRCGMPT